MSTVAKYLRISHEDLEKTADVDSVSIVNQRHLLDNYLDTHSEFEGWNRIELCDDGWTGTNFERPGMIELLDMVKKGRVQCIIVKDFSRFGRNYESVVRQLVEEVRVVSKEKIIVTLSGGIKVEQTMEL